jgi:bifunctional ADP-heptose synthase (sugar kinase/adenylyltransferase)
VTRAAGGSVIKTRILAGGIHSAKQQVVRIDRGVGWSVDAARAPASIARALASLPGADAVLMSDYGSGLVTPALARRVSSALRAAAIRSRC